MTAEPSQTMSEPQPDRRSAWQAVKRGFLGRCPQCGQGHILHAYLKVQDRCAVCGEAMHHHRADDAPPYLTILIVAHIMGFTMMAALSTWDDIPMWVNDTLWPSMVIALSLVLLPRIKGGLIAFQWALRMHGFSEDEEALSL